MLLELPLMLSEVSQIRDIYHIWNLIIHSIVATKNQKQHKRTDLHNFEELKEKEIWVWEGRKRVHWW